MTIFYVFPMIRMSATPSSSCAPAKLSIFSASAKVFGWRRNGWIRKTSIFSTRALTANNPQTARFQLLFCKQCDILCAITGMKAKEILPWIRYTKLSWKTAPSAAASAPWRMKQAGAFTYPVWTAAHRRPTSATTRRKNGWPQRSKLHTFGTSARSFIPALATESAKEGMLSEHSFLFTA